jgi:hypothetical protein
MPDEPDHAELLARSMTKCGALDGLGAPDYVLLYREGAAAAVTEAGMKALRKLLGELEGKARNPFRPPEG